MTLNTPKTTPDRYIGFGGNKTKKLSFKSQYDIPAVSQKTPWVTSRFGQDEITKRIANKRLTLTDLNFVPEGPLSEDYEMFPGRTASLGRPGNFNMESDYDFAIGRPLTPNYPEQQPDFNPSWNQAYALSPVIPPEEKTKNPFPRQDNLDPNGYLKALAEEGTNTNIPNLPDLISENAQAKTSIG